MSRQSSIPSHGCPSYQSCNIDYHDTSYGNYTNRGQQATGRSTIINYQYSPSNPLEELEKHCSRSAAFDSAARFDPPQCAESTRLRIMQTIEEWINTDGDTAVPSSLFWLRGGAGVGKSALAQSLAEKYQEKKQLAASFFFFRNDAMRNNGDQLIPTLISHLVDNFESIVPIVEDRIRKTRALFTKKYQIQIQELLVEPFLALKATGAPVATGPLLIIIDGLDECETQDIQCELLRVIARAIPQIPYPLRFFITSRPEAHLTRVFNHDSDLRAITVCEYNLSDDPDADKDILKFLEKEFVEIRQVHCLGRHLPYAWPDRNAITSLVERSSGHFIYPSTVIRYIRSPNHRPDDRLEVILRLRPPQEGDRPYAQLDALYTVIFQGVESRGQLERIWLVLGILYFQNEGVGFFSVLLPEITTIERLLEMGAGDLVLLLRPILSLIAIDGDKVRILHKSLFDYLLDFARGGHLLTYLAQVHELAATHILKQKIVEGVCDLDGFKYFAYHCRFAYLSDTLRGYLHSLEAPETIMTACKVPLSEDNVTEFLQIMWHFFRTLSREDFDSTGQIHQQYAAKWMGLLHSAVPGHPQRQIKLAIQLTKVDKLKSWFKRKFLRGSELKPIPLGKEVNYLKHELGVLLMWWKSPYFNPMEVGMEPVRSTFIEQEHSIYPARTKAFCLYRTLVFRKIFERLALPGDTHTDDIVNNVRELCKLDPAIFVSRTIAAEVCMETKSNEVGYNALKELDKSGDLHFKLSTLVEDLLRTFLTTRSICSISTGDVLLHLFSDFPSIDTSVRLVVLIVVFISADDLHMSLPTLRSKLETLGLMPITRRDVFNILVNPFVESFDSLLEFAAEEIGVKEDGSKGMSRLERMNLVAEVVAKCCEISCKGKLVKRLCEAFPSAEIAINRVVLSKHQIELNDLPSWDVGSDHSVYMAALSRDYITSGAGDVHTQETLMPELKSEAMIVDGNPPDKSLPATRSLDAMSNNKESLGEITQETLTAMIRHDELESVPRRNIFVYSPLDLSGKMRYPHDALPVAKWVKTQYGPISPLVAVFMTHAVINGNSGILHYYLAINAYMSAVPVTLKHFQLLARLGRSPSYYMWATIEHGAEFYLNEDDYLSEAARTTRQATKTPGVKIEPSSPSGPTPGPSSNGKGKKRLRRSAAVAPLSSAVPGERSTKIVRQETKLQLWIQHLSLLLKTETKKHNALKRRLEKECTDGHKLSVQKNDFIKSLILNLRMLRKLESENRSNDPTEDVIEEYSRQ